MKLLRYLIQIIIKRKWWIIILPIVATLLAIFLTRNITKTYSVSTTIFTGFASGYSIESSENTTVNMSYVDNLMDNLINIVKSKTTLENVSLRLYAEDMMYGDKSIDNNYISQKNFLEIYNRTPRDVRRLIDKTSESSTVANLRRYEKEDPKNFVYGLFNWTHPHYSYNALSQIKVNRLENSDLMEITYESNDPGITYNTLRILNEEFILEYQVLRFGETDSVIKYFKGELNRIAIELHDNEDRLTAFNVANRVINYTDQTKEIAHQSTEYYLQYVNVKMAYNSSKAMLTELEKQMDDNFKALKNNTQFLKYINNISDLNYNIALSELTSSDSLSSQKNNRTESFRNKLAKDESKANSIVSDYSAQKYTKEGLAATDVVNEWFAQLMRNIKAEAELKVLKQRKKELDYDYIFFSPIGTQIKRQERQINFLENSYLNVLQNYNAALLRKKNLEMSSASLKVINPPVFPLQSLPSKRKAIILGIFLGSLVFVITYFMILELLDRTLKNKLKAETLIGHPVLGAYPATVSLKYRPFKNKILSIANYYLFSAISNSIDPAKKVNVINVLSNKPKKGKSFIAQTILYVLSERGLKTKLISYHGDFNSEDAQYLLAQSVNDLTDVGDNRVIIIEHPAIKTTALPKGIMQEASINLFIADAKDGWEDSDQVLFERLQQKSTPEALKIYLNRTSIEATEVFTGMLPPYSTSRRLLFRISQLEIRTK